MAANTSMFSEKFSDAIRYSDLDAMWNIVCKIVIFLADGTFKKKWFKSFNSIFTKKSSRFYKLELLVFKLVKALCLISSNEFASLLKLWDKLDFDSVSEVKFLFLLGSGFNVIRSVLAKVRKSYQFFKLLESKCAEESFIKQTINKRMESFELNKGHTIQSVLEHPFRRVVLDHFVVGEELILESNLVKSRVDKIMEGWTKKHRVIFDISNDWAHQYQPLNYVFNKVFSDVMCSIGFDEIYVIVSNLPDKKAAGLSGIFNELWKHCDKSVLDMLLALLNSCLNSESVPGP
ncbi:hypothetical protein G9A89_021472 [Geosiphon pyriformis]|nr:hypothetical protein G9A89_021472 [Geosiphon pyriformis]